MAILSGQVVVALAGSVQLCLCGETEAESVRKTVCLLTLDRSLSVARRIESSTESQPKRIYRGETLFSLVHLLMRLKH